MLHHSACPWAATLGGASGPAGRTSREPPPHLVGISRGRKTPNNLPGTALAPTHSESVRQDDPFHGPDATWGRTRATPASARIFGGITTMSRSRHFLPLWAFGLV